jgi:adenosylhomocysteine nucleosidase
MSRAVAAASAAPDRPTAIVTALKEELEPLVGRLRGVRSMRALSYRFFLGTLGGKPVVMTHTGAGRSNAGRGVRTLLNSFPVARLLGAGLAGGISPDLEVGEILVGREIRYASATLAPPDGAWSEQALGMGGARGGVLVTVDEVLWSAKSKAALGGKGLANRLAAVDMESAGWAQAAAEVGIPYAVVRSVFERAEENLPEFLSRCRDPHGGLSRALVVRHALLRPRAVGDLLLMRRRARSCAERLAEFIEGILEAESSPSAHAPGTPAIGRRPSE